MDAGNDSRFHDPAVVTKLEIATASADVKCRSKHQVQKVWFGVETRIQQAAIGKNREELKNIGKLNREAVAKSTAVLASR